MELFQCLAERLLVVSACSASQFIQGCGGEKDRDEHVGCLIRPSVGLQWASVDGRWQWGDNQPGFEVPMEGSRGATGLEMTL